MPIGETAVARLVAATDVGDAAAQNNLGVVLHRAGRTAEAQHAFDRAVALDGGMSVARRNLRALAPETAAVTVAARWARVRADATDADAWRALVRHHTARGEFDAAGDVLARWESAVPTTVAPAVERARWALEAGRPDDALAAVSRARRGAGAHARTGDLALFAMLDLFEARAAYQCGDAARALAAVERARAVAPDDAEAELLRSFVLGELGATDAAAASRARATALDPTLARAEPGVVVPGAAEGGDMAPSVATRHHPARSGFRTSTDSPLATAVALLHKGYYDEALDTLAVLTLADGHPNKAAQCASIGVVHLLRGAAVDAIGPLSAALQAAERSTCATDDHAVRLAVAELLAGDAQRAERRARVVAYGATSPLAIAAAVTVRALVAWRSGDLSTARTYLLDAAARARVLDDVVRAALAANLALLLADMGVSAGAVAAGAAAVRLAPTRASAHAAHARALAQSGDPAGARLAFGRACALAPQDAPARYGLAFAAGACGDSTAARIELAHATVLSPVVRGPAPQLFLELHGAVVLPADGSGVRVPAALDAAADVHASHAASTEDAPHDYGHVDARLAAGEYDRALAAADAALARGAPAAEGLARAGHALIRSGRTTAALERYRQAAAAAPSDPAPELHVLRTMQQLGELRPACARAGAAAERWPDDPSFIALRARAAADCGAVDESVDALQRCANVPRHRITDSAAFWGDIACAWQALGAWDAAADAWGEASRAIPALPSPALARARALARAGRVDEADLLLQQLAADSPDLPEIWRARAELAIARGEIAVAESHLARVVARDAGDSDALAALAAAHADASRYDAARGAVAQVLALDPEHPLALAIDGECAAARGDVRAAHVAWWRALAVSPVGAGARRARAGLAAAHEDVAPIAAVSVA